MGFLRRSVGALSRNTDRLLKVAQIATLLWVAYEVRDMSDTLYHGQRRQEAAVEALSDKLQDTNAELKSLTLAIITK